MSSSPADRFEDRLRAVIERSDAAASAEGDGSVFAAAIEDIEDLLFDSRCQLLALVEAARKRREARAVYTNARTATDVEDDMEAFYAHDEAEDEEDAALAALDGAGGGE